MQPIATTGKSLSSGLDFSKSGVVLITAPLAPQDLAQIEAFFPDLRPRKAGARAEDFTAGARAWFAGHVGLRALASELAHKPLRLSRLQAFDKSPDANWFVPWHQDRAEDGRERPVEVLEDTVTLRIHLDDCGEDNGPIEVILASHEVGRLEAGAIVKVIAGAEPIACLAARGDIVAMRPLLLHRSKRASKPAARRVIHIEWSALG